MRIFRQEGLLTAISEKDANIAALEHGSSHKDMGELNRLYDEKDKLHQQLKELVSLNLFDILKNKKFI